MSREATSKPNQKSDYSNSASAQDELGSHLGGSFSSSCAVSDETPSKSPNAAAAANVVKPDESCVSLPSLVNNIAPLSQQQQQPQPLSKSQLQQLHQNSSSIKSSGSIKSKNKSNGSIKSKKSTAPRSAMATDPANASPSYNSNQITSTLPSNSSNSNLLATTGADALRTYNPSPSPSPTPLSQVSSSFSINNNGTNTNLVAAAAAVGVSYQSPIPTYTSPQVSIDETPNKLVYKKIEIVIEKMQDDTAGVPIRTVKSFMSKIPSVFTGTDLIQWMLKKLDVEDTLEALHFAHLIASHGYMFPIDDHILTVKNDGTFFRFQTPYYWPSNITEPENNDYAVYLCKRTMQNKTRLELADYEAENLAKLQKLLSKKWEFIYMQAEAQIKVDKKRDKMERKILDSQERAFWDVHKPAPGCVNTTEVDIRKTMRNRRTDFPQIGFFRHQKFNANPANPGAAPTSPTPTSTIKFSDMTNGLPSNSSKQSHGGGGAGASTSPGVGGLGSFQPGKKISELEELKQLDNLKKEREFLKRRLERRFVKASKVSESYTNYYEQYIEFDPFLTQPDPSNPWITDSTDFWDMEKSLKDIPQRRVRRWGFSIHELLKDPSGRELFRRFLEKEYSSENLRFYEVCSELRYSTNKDIATKVENIYNEFLAPYAHCPINIDSRVMAITKAKMGTPDRHTYDEAREHIFNLMTRDSYNRFLRSDIYRDSLNSARKKTKQSRMSIVRPPL